MEYDKKLKINFKDVGKKKSKDDFDPIELINKETEVMKVPELMEKDRKRMELFMKMNKKLR